MCRHAPIVLIPFSPGTWYRCMYWYPVLSNNYFSPPSKRKTRRHNAKQRTTIMLPVRYIMPTIQQLPNLSSKADHFSCNECFAGSPKNKSVQLWFI